MSTMIKRNKKITRVHILIFTFITLAVAVIYYSAISDKGSAIRRENRISPRSSNKIGEIYPTPDYTPPSKGRTPKEAANNLLGSFPVQENTEPSLGTITTNGNWGIASYSETYKDTNNPVGAGPGTMVLKKENMIWYAARQGTQKFYEWIKLLPENLMAEDIKHLFLP